jgi:replicative DNA helicase
MEIILLRSFLVLNPQDEVEKTSANECLKWLVQNDLIHPFLVASSMPVISEKIIDYYTTTGNAPFIDWLSAELQTSSIKRNEDVIDFTVIINAIKGKPRVGVNEIPKVYESFKNDFIKRSITSTLDEVKVISETSLKKAGKEYSGSTDAMDYFNYKTGVIKNIFENNRSKVHLKNDVGKYFDKYEQKKNRSDKQGCMFGLDEYDLLTAGINCGEFVMITAFAYEGKSTFLRNMFYKNVFHLNKFAVFGSLEMHLDVVVNLLISRHSANPKFNGIHAPIPYERIKRGTLSEDEEQFFRDIVLDDMVKGNYGECEILQIPNCSLQEFKSKLDMAATKFGDLDLACLDYLQLVRQPGRSYKDNELEQIMKDAKQLALSFNNNKGIVLATPHQINRVGRDSAEKMENYTLRNLSNTSEAERSTDIVIWILCNPDMRVRRESRTGIIKNREGKLMDAFNFYVDPDTGLICSLDAGDDLTLEGITPESLIQNIMNSK